ncbi:hypothetical protein DD237_001215 [Peronospora effusa]|uniref:RecQ-mediated genome instability protein 1 n=1 Tax=Peronospora effusa TaxID=542832 RepID=A0A3R7WC38_9STRA|nr:hypothetical protein DD237_001215 [Peronospora effusa]
MLSPPPAGRERRQLPYEALDPEWEAQEFQKFQAVTNTTARQEVPYGAYLFGRLLQLGLHQSCRPALPPDVSKLHGFTIEGMCILQVVDVANISANYEHRTEFSAAGPARTLKLGLTDGHQLVFGFEFTPLPQFSVNMRRGTKVVMENVPVRHGLLLLAPDNCQLLEASSDHLRPDNEEMQQSADLIGVGTGAYSAALVTSQFNTSQQQLPTSPPTSTQQPVVLSLATTSASDSTSWAQVKSKDATSLSRVEPARSTSNVAASTVPSASVPAVFVDVPPSDEDLDSDTTDPMVEHLFYSPKTPRYPAGLDGIKTAQADIGEVPTRKRPRSPPVEQEADVRPPLQQNLTRLVGAMVGVAAHASSSSLLDQATMAGATCAPPNPTLPFQYFEARLSTLSKPVQSTSFQVRACIKSVVGFQYNTGRYQLRVSVEDCTATKEADVADDFVTQLMGVPCSVFMETMQTKMQIAHGWAATMQFALMNLEGVMTFASSGATSSPGPSPLLLVDCRDFELFDTRALLQRVKAALSYTPR